MAILQAVVETYIATAEPVSSSAIAGRPEIAASSATVRNEMAYLEEAGLLYQPHTSAGRVPSDLGYRCYVDHVLAAPAAEDAPALPDELDPGVEATCRLLGDLTRYTALALIPGLQEHRLQHIELAVVGSDQLLVMLVTDNRQVLHSLSTVTDRPAAPQLRQLNDALNEAFAGTRLSELTYEAIYQVVLHVPFLTRRFTRQAPELVRRGLEQDPSVSRLYLEGSALIFEQQDFSEMPKLRMLLSALHEEAVFESLFARSAPGEIQVSIGAENPHPGLDNCAIVYTSYQISANATGHVGVIGPRRMRYRKVLTAMNAVVRNLNVRMGQG
ncbi:MAG TPA: heat-inducible transcriptional repressor HrcA [Armatimonadota bacterium]|nr:heat-inducible transcriptional repressor HrcA [Armatimonadota bacterium]HOS42713.1 heat-inducible transcriptional repressor HrcA [Armatimonadota bacterium]